MSAFYGTLVGNRSPKTCCGSKNSGIRACAQSWQGSIITELMYDTNGNIVVELSHASGSSTYGNRIFRGSFEELIKKLEG